MQDALNTNSLGAKLEPEPLTPDKLNALEEQQMCLYQILVGIDQSFAKIYHGAIRVFNDFNNPDRLSLSAHGLRELMEKIARKEESKSNANYTLKEKVNILKDAWNKLCPSNVVSDSLHSGNAIDGKLMRFLKACELFFREFANSRAKQIEAAKSVAKSHDPHPLPLPDPILKIKAGEWLEYYGYFTYVSHHKRTDDSEYESYKSGLERLLIDRLKPQPVKHINEIDEVLRGA